jgi:hypothetical protein
MRHLVNSALALVLVGSALWAVDDPKEKSKSDKPSAAEKAYQTLLMDYDKSDEAFKKALSEAKTPQEQQQAAAKRPNVLNYGLLFLNLAKKYPKSPFAEKALVWIVQKTPPGAPTVREAGDLLVKNHVKSEELGPVCLMLANNPQSEKKLRQIAEKNPHKEVQAQAFLALGQVLRTQSEGIGPNKEKAAKEAENVLNLAAEKYADVDTPQGSVGERAKELLADIKEFGYGKPVPDIEGQDVDGKSFKLSDYLGKVVLLDFWGNW